MVKRNSIFGIINAFLLLLLAFTCLFPFINVLAVSLSENSAIVSGSVTFLPKGFELSAYGKIFQNESMIRSLFFTIFLTVGYVAIDFAQPAEPKYEDNSAAAIVACGMLEIMKYVDDEEKAVYAQFVDKLMDILYENCDFSHDDQGILQKCSDMYHCDSIGIHHTLIYGDFYLIEALMRLNRGDALYY